MLVENNDRHSFRTAKLGFRTNGREMFEGDEGMEYICTVKTLRHSFRKDIILNG